MGIENRGHQFSYNICLYIINQSTLLIQYHLHCMAS